MKPAILICESYTALQEAFHLLLDEWATVRIVPLAEDCTRELARSQVDLLIFDVDGQTGDSLNFLTNIRTTYPELRILLVAGQFELDFQIAAVRLTLISFLTKPFEAKASEERIKVILGYSTSSIRTRIIRSASASKSQDEAGSAGDGQAA